MEMGFQENEQNQVANLMEIGYGHYGCSHYRRRCKIRAPCCDEIFDCRHYHNEAKVICSFCETEQDVQQNYSSCGVCMGKYFCSKCKFFDDVMDFANL